MIGGMNTYIVAVAVVLIIVYLLIKIKERVSLSNETNDSVAEQEIGNDKLIIVEDITEAEIHQIVQDFCNSYNDRKNQASPRLVELSASRYAIHFPKNVSFDILAFFVNYIHYPIGFEKQFNVAAWTSAKLSKAGSTEKKMLLYVSEKDTEYDNVFIVTEEGVTIKYDFGGKQIVISGDSERSYSEPPVKLETLAGKEGTDFK